MGFVLSLLPFMEANAASAAAIERERELLMFTILGWFSVLLLLLLFVWKEEEEAMRSRHWRHRVWEQGRSLGVCSESS